VTGRPVTRAISLAGPSGGGNSHPGRARGSRSGRTANRARSSTNSSIRRSHVISPSCRATIPAPEATFARLGGESPQHGPGDIRRFLARHTGSFRHRTDKRLLIHNMAPFAGSGLEGARISGDVDGVLP
jgi:hypothetical protein